MNLEIEEALEALADATRRDLFERIVIRPSRVSELSAVVRVTQPAVSHHVRVLKQCGLVLEQPGGRLAPSLEMLPKLRLYFDRLWLEAALGDGWLTERRVKLGDLGM